MFIDKKKLLDTSIYLQFVGGGPDTTCEALFVHKKSYEKKKNTWYKTILKQRFRKSNNIKQQLSTLSVNLFIYYFFFFEADRKLALKHGQVRYRIAQDLHANSIEKSPSLCGIALGHDSALWRIARDHGPALDACIARDHTFSFISRRIRKEIRKYF
jgi:hypothetical protein